MIVEKSEWKVPLKNSIRHKEIWDMMITHQRAERERWYYSISRFYSYIENDIENWMYFDEYDSKEDYYEGHQVMKEMMNTKMFKEFSKQWMALCVQDSMKTTVWTELKDLRVE